MSAIKKIASQTAVYGLSSIVGRFLNYLLVPLQVKLFSPAEYGVVTELYSYVTFLAIVLTYGMETAYFKYSKQYNNKPTVYSTAFISLIPSSLAFLIIVCAASPNIAGLLKHSGHGDYICWFALIASVDALTALPFARLRQENKAFKFAGFKLVNIFLSIALNLLFLLVFPRIGWYDNNFGVGYIFIANVIATVVTALLLIPEFLRVEWVFDKKLWKEMFAYALPLMIAGLAGMVNETFDRISMKFLLPQGSDLDHDLGIYGACYKIPMLLTIFFQAYRFAAEPYFFSKMNENNTRELYAKVMNIFVGLCCLIFLGITLYIDVIKELFLSPKYYEGLKIVPVLAIANLFFAVYVNLSMWFKWSGQTKFGVYFAYFGAAITIVFLIVLVPLMGYMGAAWATLICYVSMAALSYLIGQKKYPVPYQSGRILGYILFAVALYALFNFLNMESLKYVIATLFILIFGSIVFLLERKDIKNFV